MTQKIAPRVALVTGASRGLGAAIAEQLALRGWQVVAVARTVGGLEDLDDRVKRAGLPGAGGLTLAPMDVTNDDAMRHLCRSIHDRWGGLVLWVHAAIHAAPLSPAGHVDQNLALARVVKVHVHDLERLAGGKGDGGAGAHGGTRARRR